MLAKARSASERAMGSILFSSTLWTFCTKMSVLKTRSSCERHCSMTLTTANLPIWPQGVSAIHKSLCAWVSSCSPESRTSRAHKHVPEHVFSRFFKDIGELEECTIAYRSRRLVMKQMGIACYGPAPLVVIFHVISCGCETRARGSCSEPGMACLLPQCTRVGSR